MTDLFIHRTARQARTSFQGAAGRRLPCFGACVCALLLTARAVRADIGSIPPPPTYPLNVKLRVASDVLAARIAYPDTLVSCESPDPPCTAAIGSQARDAWLAAIGRVFTGKGTDVFLDLTRVEGRVDLAVQGLRTSVRHEAVLSDSEDEIARFDVHGEGDVLGREPEAVAQAFSRAAADAARRFESALRASSEVAAWLDRRHLQPVVAPPPFIERSRWVGFFDVGAGLVEGGDGSDVGFSGRAGVEGRWIIAQVVAETYSHSFKPNPVFGVPQDCTTQPFVRCSDVSTSALGVELGPVLRFGPGFELRAGVGIHRLWGNTGVTYYTYSGNPQNQYLGPFQARYSYAITAPGAFVGLHYADIVTRWARIRFGFEGRRLFGASVTFPELQRTVDVGSESFGVVFGVELPSAAPHPRPTLPPAG